MAYLRGDSKVYWIRVRGKRQSSGTEDKAAAEALEKRLNSDAWLAEKFGAKPPRSFTEMRDKWLAEKQHKVSFEDDVRILAWWAQHLGAEADIRAITRERVDDIILRHREGVTPHLASPANSTANHYVAILSSCLNAAARDWGWTDVAPRLRRYPAPEGREAWLQPEQWLKLREELPLHLKWAAQFALGSGWREEKVFALEWAQVDMKRATAGFKGQANKLGNFVPLNEACMAVLREIQAQPVRHMTRVFFWLKPKREGERLTATVEPLGSYGKAWWKAQERAGLGHYDEAGQWQGEFTWHGLRHTYASWLGQAGVPAHIIDRLGGWRGSSRNTRERYVHLAVDHLRPYAAVIDRVLAGERVQLMQGVG